MTAEASGEQAEDLAATMLASTLGWDFDPDAAWNERKQIYGKSQQPYHRQHVDHYDSRVRARQSLDLRDRRRGKLPVFLAGIRLDKAVQALLAGCAGLNSPDQKLGALHFGATWARTAGATGAHEPWLEPSGLAL